jgi:RNA-directed DNA polymerase
MKAPVKAGRESRMKEPHKKGIANHLDPESCADVGNHVGEALTGARAGQPSSSEITSPGVPTLYGEGEGHIPDDVTCEPSRNATESETLGMRGNSLHGNRETPKASTVPDTSAVPGRAERPEKASGRTSGVHVFGESDGSIVPEKQANNADLSAAEPVEGREPTKGNDLPVGHAPDSAPGARGRKRRGVREVAWAAARHRPEVRAV